MTNVKPDFCKARRAADEMLVYADCITGFPFVARRAVEEWSKIRVVKFSQAKQFSVDAAAFGSNSAVITRKCGRHILFYNETKPKTHRVFSILHEFGHFLLGHADIESGDIETYNRYEVETNFFAARLLMPDPVLIELQKRGMRITTDLLVQKFGVSREAAGKKLLTMSNVRKDFSEMRHGEFDDLIVNKFANFIDSIKYAPILPSYEEEFELQLERNERDFYGRKNNWW